MEEIIKEYSRNNKHDMKKFKDENTKERKHLTYNEIVKVIDSGKDIKNNENKSIESKLKVGVKKGKTSIEKYNFDIK